MAAYFILQNTDSLISADYTVYLLLLTRYAVTACNLLAT